MGVGLGGQGGCEWGSVAFVKIKKNIFYGGMGAWVRGGRVGGGGGQGGWEQRSEALWEQRSEALVYKLKKKIGGGGGGGGLGRGGGGSGWM